MFNGNSVLLRLDNFWSLFGKMSARRSPSYGVERSEGILSAPLFPRRFAGKVPSSEERENTAVFTGYQNQFIALFTLCKTFIDNLYLKKQTNKEKHSKIIKRVHMCAVFKVAKALYLDLRWTPLWSGIVNWVEWLWNPSDSFVICFCGPESAQRSKEFLSFWLYWPIKTLH